MKKFTGAYLFQIAREKLCDYVLIIYMKKIRDSLCRSKACASSVETIYSNPASDLVRSVKTTANDQNNNIQRYLHIFKAQKSSKSGWTVQGIVQSGLLLLCAELTLFCTELPENCIYFNESELSNSFHVS